MSDEPDLLGQHAAFVATTQSGKTYLVEHHFEDQDCPQLVIFLDGKGDATPRALLQHERLLITAPRGKAGAEARDAMVDDMCSTLLRMGADLKRRGKLRRGADGLTVPWLLLFVDEAGRDAPTGES